jgi:asparagine synthase (glutamine-hydrolysing)
MQNPSLPLDSNFFDGVPRFSGKAASQFMAEGSLELAWQATLHGDISAALQTVGGNFSLAIRLPDGRIVLAVDRFAIRSLCYREIGGELHFGPSADAVRSSETEIDPQAIFDYLYFHVIPSPRTIYKGIYRLPPGHFAVFEKGKLTVKPYWIPRFDVDANHNSLKVLTTEFRSILQQAAHREVDHARPACFLSGGTDSSTVAGMATLASGKTVDTYSIGFDAQGYDEMQFARIAAKKFGTRHHEYYVTPEDLVRDIPSVAAYYDQPFGNSSALPAFSCAKMARDDGVTKLLAGDGGDELFGGNTRYAKQRVFGWYGNISKTLRDSVLEPLADISALNIIPLVRKGTSYINQAKVPMPDRMMTYNLLFRLGVKDVLTKQMLSLVDVDDPTKQQRQVWNQLHTSDLVNQMLAFDWRYTLAECDLPKVVGTTALAGLQVGFPMLDHQLLAFSLKLPTEYKLKGFKLRWFFKEALRGFLPDEIISKKKQGFGLPFGVWTNSNAALESLASDSLNNLAKRGIVREEFVKSLMTQHLPAHPGYYGEMVWILMMLEQWFAAKAPNYQLAT